MHTITVQLVDDHDIVRTGFRYVLESRPGIKVVVESQNGQCAIADYMRNQPDVVVMDISMKGMNGLEATRHLLARDVEAKIVILSMMGKEAAVRALEAGAKGFLSKNSASSELVVAIQHVIGGSLYIDSDTAQEIALHRLNGGEDHPLKALSPREHELFVYLAQGDDVESIAERCHVSPKTVRSHKSHIIQKLGIRSIVDLVRLAIKSGVISKD